MSRWSVWDWIAYGCIFTAAIFLAADQGIKGSPEVAAHFPGGLGGWWAFVPLALVLIATVIFLAREVFTFLKGRAARTGASPLPTPVTPSPPRRAVSSTLGKMIFSCSDSRTGESQNLEQWRKDFDQAARVRGDAHGMSVGATLLQDGYKLVLKGKTVESVARWLGLTWTLEVRRATPDNVIAVAYLEWETLNIGGIDFAAMMNPILKMVPVDPDAEPLKQLINVIAGLLKLDESQCKMV
jgi:hypothetical protein